jgi:hypothetical protein
VQELEQRKTSTQEDEENMKAAMTWLGPRGIQTYAMEYAVQKLSALTVAATIFQHQRHCTRGLF